MLGLMGDERGDRVFELVAVCCASLSVYSRARFENSLYVGAGEAIEGTNENVPISSLPKVKLASFARRFAFLPQWQLSLDVRNNRRCRRLSSGRHA
jgi:hypothetical protein